MRRVPSEASAAERARWLAELSEALVQAQRLAWQLGSERGNSEALELYGRIEAALAEAHALRLSRIDATRSLETTQWPSPDAWALSDRQRRA